MADISDPVKRQGPLSSRGDELPRGHGQVSTTRASSIFLCREPSQPIESFNHQFKIGEKERETVKWVGGQERG